MGAAENSAWVQCAAELQSGQKEIRIFLLLDSRWQCNMKCQTGLENNKASKDGQVLSNSPDSIHVWEVKVLCEEDLKAAGEESM